MDELFYTFCTKTNISVTVRKIKPDDALFLVEIFANMGSESRYRRFLRPLDDPPPDQVWEEAERITHANPYQGEGLIAFVDLVDYPNTPIAVARYVKMDEETAEIALSVRDDWQNMGIGSQLLNLLLKEAQRAGLKKLVGVAQNGNEPIWRIFSRLPFPWKRIPDGELSELEIQLEN